MEKLGENIYKKCVSNEEKNGQSFHGAVVRYRVRLLAEDLKSLKSCNVMRTVKHIFKLSKIIKKMKL